MLIAAALCACGKGTSKQTPQLASDAGVPAPAPSDDLEAQLVADQAALQKLACAPPAPEIVAFAKPADTNLSRCLDRVGDVATEIGTWDVCEGSSFHCPLAPVPDGLRDRVAAIVTDCKADALATLAKVTPDQCTPQRAGGDPARMLLMARLVGVTALTEPPADGAAHVISVIALAGDGYRGGGDWVWTVSSLEAAQIAGHYLRVILRDPALDAKTLDALAAQLDAALATLPPLYDTFLGDPVAQITEDLRPVVHGGKPTQSGPQSPDQALFTWRGVLAVRDALTGACKRELTFAECMASLEPFAEKDKRPPTDQLTALTRVALLTVSQTVRMSVARVADVYELPLELAVRRLGRCPKPADFADGGALADRMQPKALGLRFAVTDDGNGAWHVDGPRALTDHRGTEPKLLARFACTRGKLAAP